MAAPTPSKLKVTQLRAALAERGLPTDGLKKVLVARLEAALAAATDEAEDAEVKETAEKETAEEETAEKESAEKETAEEETAEKETAEKETQQTGKRRRDSDDAPHGKGAVKRRPTDTVSNKETTMKGAAENDGKSANASEGETWIHVTGLRRPMNEVVARDMLANFGQIVDGSLWFDRIKSQMCVAFERLIDAEIMMKKMTGKQWPQVTGREITVMLCTVDDVDKIKQAPVGAAPVKSIDKDSEADRRKSAPSSVSKNRGNHAEEEARGEGMQVDDVKKDGPAKPTVKLDELFRKTTTTPVIYWLPVHEDDVERARQMRAQRAEVAEQRRNSGPRGGRRRRW